MDLVLALAHLLAEGAELALHPRPAGQSTLRQTIFACARVQIAWIFLIIISSGGSSRSIGIIVIIIIIVSPE